MMRKISLNGAGDERQGMPEVVRMTTWTAWLPAVFILFSLVALLVVPVLIRFRAEQIQTQIDRDVTPTRDLVEYFELALAREILAIRGFLLTTDEPFRDLIQERLAEIRQSEDTLRVLVEPLGPEVEQRFEEMRAAKEKWLAPNLDLIAGRLSPEAFIQRIPTQQDRYEATIEAAQELKRAIGRFGDARRREIEAVEWLGVFITAGLAVFALLSASIVLWFSLRLRLLTEQLQRHARQEQTLRHVAEAAVRTRDEVLAIVSHDLRSPLTTIYMSIAFLEEAGLTEKERWYLEVVRRSSEQMRRLIEDLLDVARIEAGNQLRVTPVRFEAPALAVEVCAAFQTQVQAKMQHLDGRLSEDLPPVHADRKRIYQVLTNLIDNAIKFTPDGGRIRLDAEAHGGEVRFSVSDTGVGIAEEDRERIFQPYWQGARQDHRGAGLGLVITKGIVEAHGGRIWVESTPGEGTTFHFTLSVAEAQETP